VASRSWPAPTLQRLQLHQQRLVVPQPVPPVLQLLLCQQREAARVPEQTKKLLMRMSDRKHSGCNAVWQGATEGGMPLTTVSCAGRSQPGRQTERQRLTRGWRCRLIGGRCWRRSSRRSCKNRNPNQGRWCDRPRMLSLANPEQQATFKPRAETASNCRVRAHPSSDRGPRKSDSCSTSCSASTSGACRRISRSMLPRRRGHSMSAADTTA
jgi:hypothetical protein